MPNSPSQPSLSHSENRLTYSVAALVSITVLAALATDLVVPVLPLIQNDLNIEPSQAQLVISVFLAGYALGQIPCGMAADRVGRLPVLYCALAVFLLGSIVCVFANSINHIYTGRLIQGFGSAGTAVLSRTLARDFCSGPALAKLLALYVAVLATLPILGPLVGGWLGAVAGWPSVFLVIGLAAVLSIALNGLFTSEPRSKPQNDDEASPSYRKAFHSFAQSRQSVWASVMLGFAFFGFMSILSGFANALIDVYQRPAIEVGPTLSAAMLFFVGSSVYSRVKVGTLGEFRLIKYAAAVFLISLLINSYICWAQPVSLSLFLLGIISYAAGLGLLFPNTTALALAPLPHIAGLASSILGTVQISFAFAGSAITAYLYAGNLNHISMPLLFSSAGVVILYWRRNNYGNVN